MKRTRGDLKPGTVFCYDFDGEGVAHAFTYAVGNLDLPGAPKAREAEVCPSPGAHVIVIWEPGDAPQSTVKHDLNRQFYDGKTAEECLEMFQRRIQCNEIAGQQGGGRVVRMTPLQLSVGRNEWRRVLAEKVKATDAETARKEREQVRVDLMFEEWE